MRSPKLMLALDLPTAEEAEAMLRQTKHAIDGVKVGLRLFVAEGPGFVRRIAARLPVFLDLKFHDIPNTVAEAVDSAGRLGVAIVNVHAAGGRRMMQAAAQAARRHPKLRVVAVTVLTSEALAPSEAQRIVVERAVQAQQAGLHGVVCSAQEAAAVRRSCGDQFLIITPGIRRRSDARQDQARIATPEDAARAGADWIVVGRPILQAEDPANAAAEIRRELTSS